MSRSDRKGFFFYLFSTLNFIRSAVVNIIFWSLVILLLYTFLPRRIHVPQDSWLHIRPTGSLVEKNSSSPVPGWMTFLTGPEKDTPAFRLSRVIRTGAGDDRVRGIILDLSDLDYASLAVLQELGSDMQFFREQGKKIYTWADSYNLYNYYLAAMADEVFMDPMGHVLLPGYSLYRTYYRKAMDKWNLDMAYFHAGEFKSYGDSYQSSSMSEALKKENSRWLFNLWDQYLTETGRGRDFPAGKLKSWIEGYARNMASYGAESDYALAGSLVDDLLTFQEFDNLMMKNFENGESSLVNYGDYERILDQPGNSPELNSVCVLTASGTIHEGESGPWSIGADTLIRRLDQAGRNSSVRALVLRLDTGGGSAYASELIRRKLEDLKKQGIRIVVSMGGITASGGYWIATAGDEVWAAPGTITGSIGVFTMIPQAADFARDTLGITSDGVGTTWMSGQERLDQNLNDSSRSYYQSSVNQTYSQFLNLVSESRHMAVTDLKPLAEGRVWSGMEAAGNGLADRTGTLRDAVSAAAALAGLDEYDTIYMKEENLDAREMANRFLQSRFVLKSVLPDVKMEIPDLEPGKVYALSELSN